MELGPAVLAVLGTWIGSRIAVLVASLLGARALSNTTGEKTPGLVELWNRWDVGLFVKVAHFGYLSPAYNDRTEVDFPGMPLAMRLVHPLVGDWVLAGMLVSLVAGLLASAALWRLAVDDAVGLSIDSSLAGSIGVEDAAARDQGRRAVLLLVCFPYAVFLFAGYSEALFLAFATTAWVAVRRRRWALAAVFTAGATATRILGIALVAAVVVEYALDWWRSRGTAAIPARRRMAELAWLALPLATLVAYCTYFQVRTGHFDAYTRAMREHWGRGLDAPWNGLATTFRAASAANQAASFRVFWWAEMLAVLVGVVLTVVLLRGARAGQARFGEATYVGVSTLIMACSTYWASGVRAVLVWFPLYLLLARRPRVLAPYLWVCAPAAVVFVVAFTGGAWVD
jgi:hypothetical protein